jgi:Ca2+-binding RTX toxin-like protein
VTVTDVVEVNSPPVADDSAISVVEGVQNTALGLLAPTDVDGDSLTITVTCLPTYGTVTLADGTAVTNGQVLTSAELTGLQYDAPAASAYNNQAVSNFTYTVFDGTNTVTGSTTITVNDSSEIGPLVADTATAAEGYWTASGSTSTTTISTVAWSASPTTDSNARNMNLQLDPAYNETKSISTSSVGATGLVTVTADPSHTASISMRVDVDGFSAGDVAKFELINSATGEVVQTINWTLIGSNDDWTITFGSAATNLGSKIVSSGVGIDASGTYYIKFTETDNTNNGSDSTADLKGTIDEIRGITQYTGTTQTITVSAPGVTWNPATNATGNVITNDTQGAEGAMVTTVTSAVVASGVTVDADGVDIAGTYGVLHIASNGAYTYTPNSDDHPTGASDVFTYTLTQPDGDSASTTLTVSLTNHTYGGTYDDTDNLTITGDGSANTLYGGGGDDTIHGGDGNDIVLGGPGNDTLYGDAGQDHLIGGTGNDTLYAGTSSSDTNATSSSMLEGGDGADSLYGTGGSDYLLGGAGNDILVGNGGNDILVGGTGSDTLTGGAGVDVFQYLLGDLSASSTDTITDFKVATYASDGDILDISDVLQGTHPTTGATLVSGGYLTFGTITYAGGNTSFTLSIDPDGSSGSTYGSTPLATFTNMTGFGSLQTGAQILQSMLDNGELKI